MEIPMKMSCRREMVGTNLICPVCSSSRVKEKPFHYLFREHRLCGYGCGLCGVIFLYPQITAEELKQLYSREYFEGGDFRCGHEGGYCEPETLQHIANPGLLLQIKALKPGGRFLEIGCAGGAFLDAARRLGFTVQGVEFSTDASQVAREIYGLPVITGDVSEAGFKDGSFDVVVMGDVIEHLPHPVATLREIHRILAPEGLLVLALPSQTNTLFSRIGFFVYTLLGRSARVALPPYHLFEYRPRSLRFLLHRCGFQITKLDQDIIPPGQINLRGPAIQRLGKKLLHYPNALITRTFRLFGDRLTVFAEQVSPES
jgi:SAM-dependent methyltransferase